MSDYKTVAIAVSRGARIEVYDPLIREYRLGVRALRIDGHREFAYRIHPDDTRYRFGPISRALYDAAQEPSESRIMAFGELDIFNPYTSYADGLAYKDADRDTRQWFLLIMAEALADLGV